MIEAPEVLCDERDEDNVISSDANRKFVAFAVGDQQLCVDILKVKEIRAWTGCTPLPNAVEYVRGIINLRGSIVPVIDLRVRFGQGMTEAGSNHVIVIVSVADRLHGLLVDSMADILSVSDENIAAIPDHDSNLGENFLEGVVTYDDKMVAVISLPDLVGRSIVL